MKFYFAGFLNETAAVVLIVTPSADAENVTFCSTVERTENVATPFASVVAVVEEKVRPFDVLATRVTVRLASGVSAASCTTTTMVAAAVPFAATSFGTVSTNEFVALTYSGA